MDSFASVALVLLGLVVFSNYRNNTLGQWLRAKFLNDTGDGGGGKPAATSDAGAGVVTAAYSDPTHQITGTLMQPIAGARITSTFGVDRGDHRHAGIDFGASYGTEVHAAAAGNVIAAGAAGAYGNKVDIDHGAGIVTRYAHLSSIGVALGQRVNRGQVIGKVGATGRATGPHLHFEVRVAGVSVNPLDWFRPAAVDAALDVAKVGSQVIA